MTSFNSRDAFNESGFVEPLTPPQRLNQLMETYDTFRGENKTFVNLHAVGIYFRSKMFITVKFDFLTNGEHRFFLRF